MLAGGLGTRLRTIISDRPKPMAEIEGGRPFLDYLVRRLVDSNFLRIIICVSYMKESIINYFTNRYGSLVEIAEEKDPLGTAGALKNIEKMLPDCFAVFNGDSYIRVDYAELFKFHQDNNSDLTITLSKVSGNRYGYVKLNGMRVVEFESDPKYHNSELVNAGVYVFQRSVLRGVPPVTRFSLERELIPNLIRNNARVMGFVSEMDFIDMGVPESYNYLKKNPDLLK
ncbi:MAG: sugar phosphate nucleotidyltransferase [Thaumarchaeota archaeon]|nr:sugar phosphate nucleotidyltransferase [Nitrososphaerota archaeon]